MPGGEMPGDVGNTSGDVGALCALARPQHRGDTGGGQPPPYHGAPQCDIQVSRKAPNGRHLGTSQCRTGTELNRRRLAEAEMRKTLERASHAYGARIEAVTEFRYLGRVLTATDDDWY